MKKTAYRKIMDELYVIKHSIMRDLVNSHDPSLDRFMHNQKLDVINGALNIIEFHAKLSAKSQRKDKAV